MALSALSWAALGLARADRPLAVQASLSGLNVLLAVLFARRAASSRAPAAAEVLAALPSLMIGGLLVRLAGSSWPPGAVVLFVAGCLAAGLSLAALGRSFGVFPASRGLVGRGPYRWVRHPAYASELVMSAGAAWSVGWLGAPLWGLAVAALVWRIGAEERLLAASPGWEHYAATVRFRLVPGAW